MENRFEIQGNSLIIHLPKEVDHMVTDEIRRDSDDIIRKKYIRTITFDFSGTAFMDSSGIGLIMGRYRMMGAPVTERGTLLMDSLILGLTEIEHSYNNRYLTVKVKEV